MGPIRLAWNSAHYQAVGANTQNLISLGAAGTGAIWVFGGLYWSTSGGTPSGTVTVETSPDGASWTTVAVLDITQSGPGFFVPPGRPRSYLTENGYIRATLSAMGSGVSSKLWIDAWKESSRAPSF